MERAISLAELYGVHAAFLTNILVAIKTLKGYRIANNRDQILGPT